MRTPVPPPVAVARQDGPIPAWTVLFWLAVFVVALVLPASPANASHRSPDRHQNKFHYASAGSSAGAQDEQYCAESHDTSQVSNSEARAFLHETLNELDFAHVWDGTGDWRLDLWVTNSNCTSYDPDTRNTIELEYHYGWDWSANCGPPANYYNCVVHDNPVYNPDYGHTDYVWEYVYLVFSSGGRLDNTGRAFINHETGHVLGLLDDNGDCSQPSIMHSTVVGYGCDNWPNYWPSQSDFASVVAGMDGG